MTIDPSTTTPSNWLTELIDEMVDDGLLERSHDGRVRKPGNVGYELEFQNAPVPEDAPSPEARHELKVKLLAILEAPWLMGDPYDPDHGHEIPEESP